MNKRTIAEGSAGMLKDSSGVDSSICSHGFWQKLKCQVQPTRRQSHKYWNTRPPMASFQTPSPSSRCSWHRLMCRWLILPRTLRSGTLAIPFLQKSTGYPWKWTWETGNRPEIGVPNTLTGAFLIRWLESCMLSVPLLQFYMN